MASPLTFQTLSDVGRQRQQNEDSRGEIEAAGGTLLIVCDGMGGHESGEVASRLAVDAISQIFQNSPADDPGERLKAGFLVANQRILAHQEKEGIDSMGTTAVAAFVRNGKAWVAHVGDSRCYQLRDFDVVWKTADHTRVQKMVERGILTAEQAKTHEDANVVTRALGFKKGEDAPEPDVTTRDLQDGDLLLLCSDGLYDLVKDDEIADMGSEASLESSTRELVELANQRGGHDNITVTIARQGAAKARTKAKRKTDLDEGTHGKSAATDSEVAKAQAEAAAAREAAERSKRALVLVVAGFLLVGLAVGAFLLTRGGGDEPTPKQSGGSGSANAPVASDGGTGSAADVTDAGSGGTPSWAVTNTTNNTGNTGNTGGPKNRKDAGVAAAASNDGGAAGVAAVDAGAGGATTATPPDAGASGGFGTGSQTFGSKPDAGVAAAKPDAGVAAAKPDAGVAAKPDAGVAAAKPDAGVAKPATKPDAGVAKPATGGAKTGSGSK